MEDANAEEIKHHQPVSHRIDKKLLSFWRRTHQHLEKGLISTLNEFSVFWVKVQ